MQARGYIDGVFGDTVRGWVVDLDQPGAPLNVVVRFDGAAQLVTAADEQRDDLTRAGISTNVGGFRVQLPQPPDAGDHLIVALIEGTTVAVPLARDARVVDSAGNLRRDVRLFEEEDPDPIAPPDLPRLAPKTADDAGVRELVVPASGAETVLRGEQGWLYPYPAEGFDLLRGVARLDRDTISALVGRLHTLLEAGAAVSLVAVLPDKLFVYPERAPAPMPLAPGGRLAERIATRLQDDDQLHLLDLLPALLRARSHGWLFGRSGSAPTWLGAFHAYRAIAKALSLALPALVPCPVEEVTLGQAGIVPTAKSVYAAAWGEAGPGGHQAVQPPAEVETPLVGFRAPPADDRPSLLVAHDAATVRIAELCTAHGEPGARVALDDAGVTAAQQRPAALVWLVSDATLVRWASASGSELARGDIQGGVAAGAPEGQQPA